MRRPLRCRSGAPQEAPINPPRLNEAGRCRHRCLTPDQHRERVLTALHEAAHIVAGVVAGAGFAGAFVRVPRKSPRGVPSILYRGAAGFSGVRSLDPIQDAISSAAAVFVEAVINPGTWEKRTAADMAEFDVWGRNLGAATEEKAKAQVLACLDRALLIVAEHWGAIDGVASALLDMADGTGVVSSKKCSRISRWIRSRAWERRHTEFELPASYSKRAETVRSTLGAPRRTNYEGASI